MKVFVIIPSIFFFILLSLDSSNVIAQKPYINAIYQFGDSIADTGNSKFNSPEGANTGCNIPPYGQTFFHHPAGRCSDGLLIVDHFSQFFNLTMLWPYLDKQGDFTHGVNFAVAGATAQKSLYTPSSLPAQLDWFKTYLTTICGSAASCQPKLENALFLVGEIGGNDYNGVAWSEHKSPSDLRSLVPGVVKAITNVVKEVVYLGAKHVIVPGNFPMGCMIINLATFKTNDTSKYDELGCLKEWNDLAAFHNDHLRSEIQSLQQQHPDVSIIYADYYSALRSTIQQAPTLGFSKDWFRTCCGKGDNEYNFGGPFCGSAEASVCPDPNKVLSWDGIHLTQRTYQVMADWLLTNIFP